MAELNLTGFYILNGFFETIGAINLSGFEFFRLISNTYIHEISNSFFTKIESFNISFLEDQVSRKGFVLVPLGT
jgi:hypothetical protein